MNERTSYATPFSQHFHHHPQLGKSKECSPGVCFHGRASVTEGVRRRSLDFQVLVGCPHSVENDNVTITTLQQKVGLAVHFPKYLRQRSGLVEKVCWKVAYSLTKAFLRPPECAPARKYGFYTRVVASVPVPDLSRTMCC